MRITLNKSSSNGGMEPEQTIFCNQAILPQEESGHQPNQKTFNLQFGLPARYAGVKVAQKV